jgi:hypothetical protein
MSPNRPDVLFATLLGVTNTLHHVSRPQVRNHRARRAARVLAPVLALLASVLVGTMSAAQADAPNSWENTPPVSPLHVLLILVILPLGLFVLITLLVYIPSMSKAETYQPGQAWRGEATWFGGPRAGLDAVQTGSPAQIGAESASARGGASGRW